MTDDEFDRKMEFLVEWQARFAADIEILKQRQDRTDAQLVMLTSVANRALEMSTRTVEVVTTLAETLGAAQVETQRQVARVAMLLEAHIRQGHPPDVSPG